MRLVFDAPAGPALNASLIDLGNRFRLIVNEVDVVPPDHDLPKLPVARALWVPRPSLKVAAAAWILAGGAHHTGFSQPVTARHLEDFAEMAGMEGIRVRTVLVRDDVASAPPERADHRRGVAGRRPASVRHGLRYVGCGGGQACICGQAGGGALCVGGQPRLQPV